MGQFKNAPYMGGIVLAVNRDTKPETLSSKPFTGVEILYKLMIAADMLGHHVSLAPHVAQSSSLNCGVHLMGCVHIRLRLCGH